jgi:hypothetical protein
VGDDWWDSPNDLLDNQTPSAVLDDVIDTTAAADLDVLNRRHTDRRRTAVVDIGNVGRSRGSKRLLGSADKPSRPSTVEDRPADLVSQPLIL